MILRMLSYDEIYYSWHNSWTQELLLEIISPAIEQLLNRNLNCGPCALMPGSLGVKGIYGLHRFLALVVKSSKGDDDYGTPNWRKKRYVATSWTFSWQMSKESPP